jgi:TonB-linked SusC/RagA family outer membrane protein
MYVSVHQTLRAMQVTAFLLTACCLTVSAGTLSQSNITFSGKDVKLETVFQAVKNQTGYFFIYNKDVISKASAVTVNVKNIPLQEFMEMVLKDQDLEWVLQKTTIVIQKKKELGEKEKVKEGKPTPITGIVRGPDGQPLAGINVTVKGTKRGAVTDNEGRFTINADEGNVLQISAIGFGKKEIKVNGFQQVNIALEIASSVLDEVQYIAYGQESKRFSVSNIGSVKAADIEKQPVQNVLLALQARVPGLFITQPSGISGTGVKVRIQGQNSIANGSDPMYVVDGIPIDAQLSSTGFEQALTARGGGWGSPLNFINPLDIESIEVLKDADATAIYGSRAANGAILITTKKGKAGVMKLDLNLQTGWGKMTRRMDMMNTRQYLDMRYEALRNDNIDWRSPSVSANDLKVWDTTSYTNWQDELLGGTSHYSDINASISGGSSTLRYLISGTYHKETTVFPFPDFADQKAAVHFSLNANNNNKKLSMQFSGNYMFDNNKLPQQDLTQSALLNEPNAPPLLNADGSINWAPDAAGNSTISGHYIGNVMIQRYHKYENKTYNLVSNLKLAYNLLPGLNIGSSFGYNQMQTNDYYPMPLIAVAPELRATTQRGANFGNRKIQSWIVEPQANYRTKVIAGTFDVIIGSTFQSKTEESNPLTGIGQLTDELLNNINSAATIVKGAGASSSAYRYSALFARSNYNWRDKYIVNVNMRRDGSSRFGPDNRFNNFVSVGGAWIFSGENFFKPYTRTISFGKFRGSYGTTGSDQIGDYQFMSLYNLGTAPIPYQGVVGLYPAGLPNPKLEWEQTRKLQLGIDVGLLEDKFSISATFVRNRSSNQLLSYTLPTQTGSDNYLVNFPATIQNKNWELLVTGKIWQTKNILWTSAINLTIPQNKLIEFSDLDRSTYSKILHVGAPMDAVGAYQWLGVAPGTGDYLFADKKGNPTITPNPDEDRTVLISNFPKFYGGFENTISYKGFQLSFILQFVKQTGYNNVALFNGFIARYPGMFGAGVSNQPVTLVDRWQKPGDNNKPVARFRTTEVKYAIDSDRRFADASYIRLKNVSVSWVIPQSWIQRIHATNLQVYLHGQNLLTFTNYKGLDPETQGLSLPPLQVLTVGIKLSL